MVGDDREHGDRAQAVERGVVAERGTSDARLGTGPVAAGRLVLRVAARRARPSRCPGSRGRGYGRGAACASRHAAGPALGLPAVTRFGRVLLVIVAVAFGVRVAYVAIAKAGPCPVVLADGTRVGSSPSKCVRGDELFYNAEANYVADGHGFNEPLVGVHPSRREAAARRRSPAAHRLRPHAGVVARRSTRRCRG